MNLIPYSRQWIDEEDINEVIKALKSDFITQGPKVIEFEAKLAEYCGAKYAVVFNSGTSALHAAYFASGLKESDEFITSPNTFVATSNAGIYLGAKPVFADIEDDTGNIDALKIEEKITKRTKIIVPIHYSGHPVDLEKISEIAKKYNLLVIEDACHAIGSKYKEENVGSCKYSDMTVFSFHPVKNITTGEGGAVLTNNDNYYEKLHMFRTHGITKKEFFNTPDGDWYYEMQFLGYNYRITDIQSALGLSQLKKVDKFTKRKREIARMYEDVFRDNLYFDIPFERAYSYSSHHLYPIRLKDDFKNKKKEIFSKLKEKRLGVQVHYIPVYLQPYYQQFGFRKGICPKAEDFYQREISIPLYQSMTADEINYVIETILKVFKAL